MPENNSSTAKPIAQTPQTTKPALPPRTTITGPVMHVRNNSDKIEIKVPKVGKSE